MRASDGKHVQRISLTPKSDLVDQIAKEMGMEVMVTKPVEVSSTDYEGLPEVAMERVQDAVMPKGHFLDDLETMSKEDQQQIMKALNNTKAAFHLAAFIRMIKENQL